MFVTRSYGIANMRSPSLSPLLRVQSFSAVSSHSIVLRSYQERCLDACVNALRSGLSRIGVSLPTGSGKTTVFLHLLSRIPAPARNSRATKSLIIVNSVELARQAALQAQVLFPEWKVEIEQGVKHKASGFADVTVATYQTLLQPQRIDKFNPNDLKAVIVDEAHHAAAPSYRRLLSQFNPDIKNPDLGFHSPSIGHIIPIIGFSATFSRHDGLALGSVFERIVYHRDFLEMIRDKWLCDVRFTSVRTRLDLQNVTLNSRTGDFNASSLSHVVNTETVNRVVVQSWLDRASTRKSTLVFCVNLSHVKNLTNKFREFGVDARYVYSGTPVSERENMIASFKRAEFPILVNCAVLTEGADIPNIDCVVVARPTRSRNVFAQMIGRGMRLSPESGKQDCHIIDFVESTDRVSGVISTPTLFGLDPNEIIDGDSVNSLVERAMQTTSSIGNDSHSADNNIPEPQSITYVDHDDPFGFVHKSSGAPHVARMSPLSWVGCGNDIYILECLGKGHIRIEPVTTDGTIHYQAFFTPAIDRETAASLKIAPFLRSRKVLTAENLNDAVRGCDTYAEQKAVRGPLFKGMFRTAVWRKQSATDNQKAFIGKCWDRRYSDPSESQSIDDRLATMTKGEAAGIITRLRHGAEARYQKKIAAQAKTLKTRLREQRRRQREIVIEGPLPMSSEI